MTEDLKKHYLDNVVPALREQFGLTNVHQVPKIEKIVINCGYGGHSDRKQAQEDAMHDMGLITGQRPLITRSKNAVSNFKLRAGEPIGLKVTLRGQRMWDFLLRFLSSALPKIRDFRGINPKGFDGRGNYSVGISDHTIFPEIEIEKVKRQLGMDVTVVTSTNSNDEAYALLKALGFPFREHKPNQNNQAA